MKRNLLVVTLLVVVSLTGALTQNPSETIKVDVPFAFHSNRTTFPSGHYTVKRVWANNASVLRIANDQGQVDTVFTSPVYGSKEITPQLIFQRYGNTYFLRRIVAGPNSGSELPRTPLEKEYARRQKSEVVAVVGRQ